MESLLHNYKLDLSWCLRINLAFDVSRGMQYLHSNGMLHRDLNSRVSWCYVRMYVCICVYVHTNIYVYALPVCVKV